MKMFKKIVHEEPVYKAAMTEGVKDLIGRLLQNKPENRIGARWSRGNQAASMVPRESVGDVQERMVEPPWAPDAAIHERELFQANSNWREDVGDSDGTCDPFHVDGLAFTAPL
jgi:hypothetical protein